MRRTWIVAVMIAHSLPAWADPAAIPEAKAGILGPGVADRLLPQPTSLLIDVLDPGTAPRRPLRYAPKADTNVTFEDSVEVLARLATGGDPPREAAMPRKDRTIAVKVLDVSKAGAHVTVHVQGAGSIRALVDPTGRLSEIVAERNGLWPEPTGFQTSIVVFPDPPIGIGARWRIVRRGTGDATVQIETYTLVSHAGPAITLSVAIEQVLTGPKQKIPGGGEINVRHYKGHGEAIIMLTEESVVPLSEKRTLTSIMDFSAGADMRLTATTATRASSR